MSKYKYKIIAIILVTILLLPLITSVTPLICYAENIENNSDNNTSFLKGILLILLSIFINKYQIDEEKPDNEIDEQQYTEPKKKNYEITGFYVNWLTQDADSYLSLAENYNSIHKVSPFWYTLDPDGSIKNRYGGHQYEVASLTEKQDIQLIPLINNNQQNNMVLIDPATRKKAIANIVKLVNDKKYAGINIDFEFLPTWTRASYTNFIRELSHELKKHDKLLVISVFPKIDVPINLQGAYDYSGLAPHVDQIVIMTYDHHWATGPSGPVAPISWVESNIKYALEYIPREKLLLGIANYGYDWPENQIGKDLGAKRAHNLAAEKNVNIQWHNEYKVPYFTYRASNGLKHEVWFENSYSLEHKLDLVTKYNLEGIAIWRLGNEKERFWEVINEKL